MIVGRIRKGLHNCRDLAKPCLADIFGPSGAGNPNISGFYFDDFWTAAGPSEMDPHVLEDIGFDVSRAEVCRSGKW